MTQINLHFQQAPTRFSMTLAGIQGPPSSGGGGGVSDGDKVGIIVSGTGTIWTVKDGSITALMLGSSAIALFAAASHSHIIANVIGLQAALDGKASAAHTHVAADVTDFAATTRGTVLTGYAAAGSRIALAAGDTVLGAFGKIGKWLNDLAAIAFTGSASDLSTGTLPAARFDDTAHGARAGGALHANAIAAGAAGFMTGADKTKLDGLTSNATHTGDASGATVLTLATVNGNVGSFGLAGSVAQFVVNAKGLITSAVNVAISIASTAISDSTAAGRAMLTAATAAAQTALLDVFTSGAKGLTPASGGGTANFLRADGTWAAPGGGGGSGDVVGPASATDNALARFDTTTGKLLQNSVNPASDVGEIGFPVVASPATPAAGVINMLAVSRPGGAWPAFITQDGIVQDFDWDQVKGDVALISPIGNSTTLTLLGCGTGVTGTATSANMADTNAYTRQRKVEYLVTVAAATAVAGLRMATAQWSVGGNIAGRGGFRAFISGAPCTGVTTATHRFFMGMWGANTPTDVEPSSLTSIVGVGYDAADANLQFMHNDGSGACTKIDLGASFPVPTVDRTDLYELELYAPPGTTQSVSYRVLNRSTGAVATGTITTNLPATATYLTPHVWASVGGTSSVIGAGIAKMAALVLGKA